MLDSERVIRPIAAIHTDLPTKFGLPRQSGLVEGLEAKIVFLPPYRDPVAFRGLEGYSHLWLIWGFSENSHDDWAATVKPPRLGGNRRMGVFATRSPLSPKRAGPVLRAPYGYPPGGKARPGAVCRRGRFDGRHAHL